MVAEQCECTQHHRITHLKKVKMVNFTLCVFYHTHRKEKPQPFKNFTFFLGSSSNSFAGHTWSSESDLYLPF